MRFEQVLNGEDSDSDIGHPLDEITQDRGPLLPSVSHEPMTQPVASTSRIRPRSPSVEVSCVCYLLCLLIDLKCLQVLEERPAIRQRVGPRLSVVPEAVVSPSLSINTIQDGVFLFNPGQLLLHAMDAPSDSNTEVGNRPDSAPLNTFSLIRYTLDLFCRASSTCSSCY